MYKKILISAAVLITFLTLILIATGCSIPSKQAQAQNSFDTFMNNLFVEEVKTNTLSLNYSLAYPEKYGIENNEVTLGEYGLSQMKENFVESENYLSRLHSFDYKLLTSNQKLTYDIVKNYLEQDLQFGHYMYYGECLGPTTGIQAQLPILLAEYSFKNKEDIENYLKLLPCVKDYFDDIIQYEREKSAHGLFMNDNVAQHIIDQCSSFIHSPQDNFLISYFNEKLSSFEGLTRAEINSYQIQNKEAVLCYIIPAYNELINALTALKGTGQNNAGLYYYPEGQAYYECLAKSKTGSDKSMKEILVGK